MDDIVFLKCISHGIYPVYRTGEFFAVSKSYMEKTETRDIRLLNLTTQDKMLTFMLDRSEWSVVDNDIDLNKCIELLDQVVFVRPLNEIERGLKGEKIY